MEKKQTAVEWLVEQLTVEKAWLNQSRKVELIKQAKEMEKKQIVDASNGYTQTEYLGVTKGEQYYNQTFKSE